MDERLFALMLTAHSRRWNVALASSPRRPPFATATTRRFVTVVRLESVGFPFFQHFLKLLNDSREENANGHIRLVELFRHFFG